jgi:ABC-type branched-subunit amino acid transport system substrate-binding protein
VRLNSRLPGVRPTRRAALGIIAVSAAGLLAACSSSGFGGGFGGMGAGNGPQVRADAPVTGEVIGSGTVRVAMLLPLSATGNAGQIAANFKNAAALALQDFKSANIQIMVKDDQGTPQGAGAAASEAISQGAQLILGPLFARSVSAVAAVARPANVPVIAFSSDTTAASQGVYLLSFLPQSDVDRVISFAAGRGKRSFAALLPNNAYGTLVEAEMQRAAANAGARVVASLHYDLDKTSMQTQATSLAATIKSGAADAVFLPDAGDAAPFLAQILAANGVTADKITYLGSGQWDADPRISSESNLNGGWYPAPESAGFASFARRYQAAFGAAPSRTASLAYDATSLAAGLTARFGDQRFAQATLTNPNGFIGIDGAFRFLSNGLNQRGLAVFQVGRGSAQMIDPAPRTFTAPSG